MGQVLATPGPHFSHFYKDLEEAFSWDILNQPKVLVVGVALVLRGPWRTRRSQVLETTAGKPGHAAIHSRTPALGVGGSRLRAKAGVGKHLSHPNQTGPCPQSKALGQGRSEPLS